MKKILESDLNIYFTSKICDNPKLEWLWQGEKSKCRYVYIGKGETYELVFNMSEDPDQVIVSRCIKSAMILDGRGVISVHTCVDIDTARDFMSCRMSLNDLWRSSKNPYIAIVDEGHTNYWYECTYDEIRHLVEI